MSHEPIEPRWKISWLCWIVSTLFVAALLSYIGFLNDLARHGTPSEVVASFLRWGVFGGLLSQTWAIPVSVVVGSSSTFRALARRKRNHCVQCGYSLRGNVSGRCPECGTEVQS